jgi:PST family polysaccharide transporter
MVLFGEQWLGMVPLVRILSLLGAFQSIFTIGGSVYHSLGRPDIPLKINILASFLMISGISIGLYIGGIVEVAIGYAIGSMLNLLPNLYFLSRMLGISVKQFIKNFTPQFIISSIMCLFVSWLGFILKGTVEHMPIFIMQGFCGVSIYISINHLFSVNSYTELINIAKEEVIGRKAYIK